MLHAETLELVFFFFYVVYYALLTEALPLSQFSILKSRVHVTSGKCCRMQIDKLTIKYYMDQN